MIRRADTGDVPELLRLLKQVNNVHAAGRPDLFRMDGTKYDAGELEELLRDGDRPVFVRVRADGTAEGYAFCVLERHQGDHNQTDRLTLYIDDICVDDCCRGQGVGRSLYGHALAYARDLGCYNVTLNVWCLNPGAMKFYEAMGMTPYKVGMEKILHE